MGFGVRLLRGTARCPGDVERSSATRPGAQTVIDEFLSSGEQKMGAEILPPLLLPHGSKDKALITLQHASERFLQMCAQKHDRGNAHDRGLLLPPPRWKWPVS